MFDGPTIFWLIAIGLLVGGIARLIMWNTIISLTVDLIAAVAGALVIGAIMAIVQLPGVTMISTLGSITTVFIVNIFYQPTKSAY